MKKIDVNTVREAEAYVLALFGKDLDPGLTYHTADHTRFVARGAEAIGKEDGLDDHTLAIARLAAWFHDVGYAYDTRDHESKSAEIASSFLADKQISEEDTAAVLHCIEATRIPQDPGSEAARVVCDADMLHLAAPDYFDHIERLRQERKYIEGRKITKQELDRVSIKFFDNHQYHTRYGKQVLQEGKEKNYAMIEEKINKRDDKKEQKDLQKEVNKLNKKLEKQKGYSRGVESMFRLTARNQINLSSIADNKSNILISVNTIIISIVLTVLVSRFSEYPNIILPSLIFLTFSLITIIFAILSTRPNISSGTFTKDDIREKKVNLLFFGNFYNMGLEDYDWALGEMMREDDYLYSTMIKDQYFLGKVLAKKYKLLRKAYDFFMFGLIISVIAYVLAFTSF